MTHQPRDHEFTPEQERVLEHRAALVFFSILAAAGVLGFLAGFLLGRFVA